MRVLIIGALSGHATNAAKIALGKGAKVMHVLTIEEGMNCLRTGKGADIVLADAVLDLKKLLKQLKQERISIDVVACGVDLEPENASEAIKAGVKDFLPLPPDTELISAILKILSPNSQNFLYEDPKMSNLIKKIDLVLESDAHILITGESGTGKEVIAKYIHEKSSRASFPFVSINCAAIPDNLLESELFGHEKGAFTGAIARRIGKFEESHRGTLLLDEVSEMDLRLQAKLLRAIQEKKIDRIGGQTPIDVSIRILATSNRNLLDAIKFNSFREDLYFRLNVVNIQIPPLRDRILDIMPLANYFCSKYSKINNKLSKNFSKDAIHSLMRYSWPGNIRELENVVHRSVLFSQYDQIEVSDLFDKEPVQNFSRKTLIDVEKDAILETLSHCLGNKTHAATILGISIKTLRNKLKEYNLDRDAS